MDYTQLISVSNDLIKLFDKHIYEEIIFSIMESSKKIFPDEYEYIKEQSHGEPDYVCKTTKAKFDAKLPFLSEQIKMLTNGKKHSPKICEWLEIMYTESSEFNPLKYRENKESIKNTKLYIIMKDYIMKDKEDENFIFFIPFPVVPSFNEPFFLDLTANFLTVIFEELEKEFDFSNRSIYVICPSSFEKNKLTIRNLKENEIEYLECKELEQYISFDIYTTNNDK